MVSIVSSVILRRLDKKPDRVEISEEQLVQATLRAEELAAEVNRPLRVVGWYHSHPHITVWPSHVGKLHIIKQLTIKYYYHQLLLFSLNCNL